jgi:hypothetical protein
VRVVAPDCRVVSVGLVIGRLFLSVLLGFGAPMVGALDAVGRRVLVAEVGGGVLVAEAAGARRAVGYVAGGRFVMPAGVAAVLLVTRCFRAFISVGGRCTRQEQKG